MVDPTHPCVHGRRTGRVQRATSRRDDERGAAMVEFALIAPLLLALVFAVVSFGWMLSYRQGVSQAAVEGARAIAVAPSGATNLQSRAESAIDRSLGSYGISCTGGSLKRDGVVVGTCTITPRTACSTGSTSSCATVTIDHRYRDNPLLPSFPGLGITLPEDLSYSTSVEVD